MNSIILISLIVVVLVIVVAILFSSVAIIHTGEVGIVERLGKYVATLEPGFHMVPPLIYRITEIVNMKQIPLKVDELARYYRQYGFKRCLERNRND